MATQRTPAEATQKPEEAKPSFLTQLATLATPVTDLASVVTKKDLLINARTKFSANCDETIKVIKSAAEQGKFFRKLPDGYLITFRNANSVMKLNDAAHFKVTDAPAAIRLIEAAREANTKGELDDAFRATARSPRKPKSEAVPKS